MQKKRNAKKIILCGAGTAGRMIAREIVNRSASIYHCVGFLDDDPEKQGWELEGVPVLGTISELPRCVEETSAEEVLIAIPSASGAVVRKIAELCNQIGVAFRVLPSLFEVVHGNAKLGQVRDVRVEDLLRRSPIQLDMDTISDCVSGETVLVTGAGGSIGGELCRQLITFDPARIVLLGHGENSIFATYHDLIRRKPHCEIVNAIVDLRNRSRLERVLETHQPRMIFHAAAHKHVPLMEDNPCEAFANNVGSILSLAELAPKHGCKKLVMISTDKAVEPCNAMGASKAVCEVVTRLANSEPGDCRFITVRFGNVLGSRGSVIGLFRDQIERGGPLTITDERMERFFMTIPEAVELVLQAGAVGEGGEVFVLDMGQPLRIIDLARMLLDLTGFTEEEIPIVVTGLRPGERLYESLFSHNEERLPSPHPQLLIARRNGTRMDHWELVQELLEASQRMETDKLPGLVKKLVADSSWQNAEGYF